MDGAESVPAISFKALQHARQTLEDFALSYLPLYNLDPQKVFLRHMDTLVFIEALIYQIDDENEKMCQMEQCNELIEDNKGLKTLNEVLEKNGILSEGVKAMLEQGLEYWKLEREITSAIGPSKKKTDFTIQDVHRCCALKSFDYRAFGLLVEVQRKVLDTPWYLVLHMALLQLLKIPINGHLMEFLAIDEQLLDIGDDLVDYEDDIIENSFNVYRAYVALFGKDAPLQLVNYISSRELERSKLLERLPTDIKAAVEKRQKEAAEKPGSDKWVFPEPIIDEGTFTNEVKCGDIGTAVVEQSQLKS